eukprot:COSAG05_NODE_116_length_17986_cov_348.987534_1_plen_131_part_00
MLHGSALGVSWVACWVACWVGSLAGTFRNMRAMSSTMAQNNRVAEQLQRDLSKLRARHKQRLEPTPEEGALHRQQHHDRSVYHWTPDTGDEAAGAGADGADRRLEAYNTIPVVSSLLFGAALAVVLMLRR